MQILSKERIKYLGKSFSGEIERHRTVTKKRIVLKQEPTLKPFVKIAQTENLFALEHRRIKEQLKLHGRADSKLRPELC